MKNDNSLPYGVIFDMDGVLVDSEKFICKAACLMFEEIGLHVKPDDFLPFVGTGEDRYIGGVAEKYNFPVDIEAVKKRTYDIYLEIIQGALRPLPGVHQFVKKCKDTGKKIAVASSADRRKVMGNLKEIGLGPDVFDAIVVGEDVSQKKPAPDLLVGKNWLRRIYLPPTWLTLKVFYRKKNGKGIVYVVATIIYCDCYSVVVSSSAGIC